MPRVVAASDAILAAERAVQHATTWRVVGLACASSRDAFEDALRLRGDSDGLCGTSAGLPLRAWRGLQWEGKGGGL